MLRTRLWMGSVLVALTIGALVVDQRLGPWFPFLFLLLTGLGGLATWELLQLLPPGQRPVRWLGVAAVMALATANWPAHLLVEPAVDAWLWIVGVFAAVVLAAFLVEMAAFREPGESVTRIGTLVWVAAYLGVLPAFFAQLRWRSGVSNAADAGTVALALVVFVPKCGDIGAYFTGRFLGRHQMAPVLSPKKTWEGAVGGLAASVAAAVGFNRLGPALNPDGWTEVGFGITVGIAGMLGDLAESLIKRDCQRKDASQVVPGFGGVLDVIDSVVFAAPVAYWWLK
jgi:phosphatidate cytidylyltransferase